MARPRRIEIPGAYYHVMNYHVMNRSNRREDIFVADQDRNIFLDGLADSCALTAQAHRLRQTALTARLVGYAKQQNQLIDIVSKNDYCQQEGD